MALLNGFVGAPVAGGIFTAPLGSTLPTDAKTDLDKAFKPVGFLSDEGLSLTRDRSTDDIRKWGGEIYRTVQTEFSETAQFAFLDADKAEVLREVFGAENVTGEGSELSIKHNGDPLPGRVFVFEMKDGSKRRRFVIPNGQITQTEDIKYSHSDIVRYGVTVTAYPDKDGNCAYEYQTVTDASSAVAA